jgi:hypothetical protein
MNLKLSRWVPSVLWLSLVCPALGADSEQPVTKPSPPATFQWQTDYRAAVSLAKAESKFLFLWFHKPQWDQAESHFANSILTDQNIFARLQKMIGVSLPTDVKLESDRGPSSLLSHSAFSEMLGLPGVAVIDYTDPKSRNYGQVVSVYPFRSGRPLNGYQLAQLLDLPKGTLTQRTLILAVRMHAEVPASTTGRPTDLLFAEAEGHANFQASTRTQGHQNFDARFQRIVGQLGGSGGAKEVCAESWPNQRLVEAAEDCVHSWRQSPGHWGAVRAYHPMYGYDMKLGSNGIWYATGLFAGSGG